MTKEVFSMTNKKYLAPFFVAMSMLLVACSSDTIVARPTWQDDSIIDVEGLKDNKLKEIYDAVKNLSETNPNILNKVMFNIAKKQIGSYQDLYDFKNATGDVWKEQKFKDFVNSHPIYKADKVGYTLDKGKQEIIEGSEVAYKNSYDKVINQFNKIKDSIFEKLYNDVIKSADYADSDKLFQEEYFVYDYLVPNMFIKKTDIQKLEYKCQDGHAVMPKAYYKYNDGTKEIITWENFVKDYMNISSNAQGKSLCGFSNVYFYLDENENEDGYIGRKMLPEIYRSLLIDTYVREQRYSNLGRSQARKVNMISVPKISKSEISQKKLLTDYVDNHIINIDTPDFDFEEIKDLMVGFIKNNELEDYLNPITVKDSDSNPIPIIWCPYTDDDGNAIERSKENDVKVYEGTKLGDLVQKYININDVVYTAPSTGNPTSDNFKFTLKQLTKMSDDEKNFFNELTDNGKRLPEQGLIIKEREIRATDMTTDGWALKDGGLSELGEDYRNRLFSNEAVSIVDNDDKKGDEDYETGDYVRYINKNAFLTTTREGATDKAESIVCEDDKNFYIVNIEEAANTRKLSLASEYENYLQLRATNQLGDSNKVMDEIVTHIVQKAASSDTYKKNAEQYYLMISNIVINDDSVYDYFKSQFPDLFK